MSQLDLEPGATALDVGSSTRSYRLEQQPHIERNVAGPLRERGVDVKSLDIRADPGVDYVCDLGAPEAQPVEVLGRRFPLVLCNNVLVHLSNLDLSAPRVSELVAPGGWLLASTPEAYRRVRDPLDNGFRPSPQDLAHKLLGSVGAGRFQVLAEDRVVIETSSYYRRSPLKPSFFRLGGMWLPVPSVVEQLRYAVPALRWRVSCVLMRRTKDTG